MGDTIEKEVKQMEKDKMKQIFEIMSDIALARLNKCKEAERIPNDYELDMVSATLQMYNFIADNHQPPLFE